MTDHRRVTGVTLVHCDGCHVSESIPVGPQLRVYLRALRRFRDRHHGCGAPIVQKLAPGVEGEDVGLRGSHKWHRDTKHAKRSIRTAAKAAGEALRKGDDE